MNLVTPSSRIDGGVHGCKISSNGWCYETVADGDAGAGIIDRGRMFVAARNACPDRETATQSRRPRDRLLCLSEALHRGARLGTRGATGPPGIAAHSGFEGQRRQVGGWAGLVR